jgi:hypothetical protein
VTPQRGRWLVLAVPASLHFFSYFHRVAPAVVLDAGWTGLAVAGAALFVTETRCRNVWTG